MASAGASLYCPDTLCYIDTFCCIDTWLWTPIKKLPTSHYPTKTESRLRSRPSRVNPLSYSFTRAPTPPGCTIEACGFRDHYGQLTRAGFTVLGISPDTSKAQKKFQEKFSLPYTLLADADKNVAQLFGVLKEKNMYGKKVMGIERTTFLIAPDGNIAHVWRKVKPEGHAEQILAEAKSP